MKPRNKWEKELVRMNDQLTPINQREKMYAKRHCFSNNSLESRNRILCTECGGVWSVTDGASVEYVKCPHCGKVHLVTHNKMQCIERTYFCIATTKCGLQAIDWYLAVKESRRQGIKYDFRYVGTEWIRQDGYCISFSRKRNPISGYIDAWSFGSKVELKNNNIFAQSLAPSAIYFRSVLPVLKRNGWQKSHSCHDYESIHMSLLLSNGDYESAVKCGHKGVCLEWCKRSTYTHNALNDMQKTLLKLANRRGFKFDSSEKWIDYCDHIKNLSILHRDIHNPTNVFPNNFAEEHVRLAHKIAEMNNRRREAHRREMAIKRAEEDELAKAWMKEYAKIYAGMVISENGFTIVPLIEKTDFHDEHDAMHHCIETYYGKRNTLLLSIKHDGKKTETAEISLLRKEIVQCRGCCNLPSQYHDDIMALLRKYLNKFVKMYKNYEKNKEKEIIGLPAPISFYKAA